MKDNKEKLFENMEKLNPDFKIQELIQQTNQQKNNQQPRQPADVQSLNRATQNTQTIKTASQRINTSTEFPEAFRVWFSSLGYKPDNPAISIMRVKTEIEKVMRSMGYK